MRSILQIVECCDVLAEGKTFQLYLKRTFYYKTIHYIFRNALMFKRIFLLFAIPLFIFLTNVLPCYLPKLSKVNLNSESKSNKPK